MSKTTLLIIAVVALFVLNIGAITALVWGKPLHHPPRGHHHHKNHTKQVVIDKLQFSPSQIVAYEQLIEEHRAAIKTTENEMRAAKHALYKQLKKEEPNIEQPFIQKIGAIQMALENIHFKHFKAVKKLCTVEQLKHFNQLSEEIARLLAPKRPRK